MQIAIGDIWTKMSDDSSAVCVTTNGIWKKNGLAVMGKGFGETLVQSVVPGTENWLVTIWQENRLERRGNL